MAGGSIVGGDGLARFQIDLQRSENALGVGGMEPCGAFRVHLPQLCQQRLNAVPVKPGLQFPAHLSAGVSAGEAVSPDQGVHPQSGAAH